MSAAAQVVELAPYRARRAIRRAAACAVAALGVGTAVLLLLDAADAVEWATRSAARLFHGAEVDAS